jgi:hypothetical protein
VRAIAAKFPIPRFGETTYELTGIVQGEPNASLFQIPGGCTEAAGGVVVVELAAGAAPEGE